MTRWVGLQALGTATVVCFCFFMVIWAPMVQREEKIRAPPRLRLDAFRPTSEPVQITLWSSDFHIAPPADLKHLFTATGMGILGSDVQIHMIDKSLSAHCHITHTCAQDLMVLNPENGLTLDPCPNELKLDFFEAYQDDPEMQSVDAFLCNHAAALCEVFMPFTKPMIVLASTRYELGRHYDVERWREWNQNLELIAKQPGSIVAANNAYDAEYIKYFTAIPDVPVIQSYCGYVDAIYTPMRLEILVGPARGVNQLLYEDLESAAFRHGRYVFASIRELYPSYTYEDLAAHPAMVILPYQVSFMSLFEAYRMAIPLFVPAPELLTRWHLSLGVLFERTWATVEGAPQASSMLRKHPRSTSRMKHDPNNEFSFDAILEWVQLADFYQWPHITRFHSFEDLMHKLDEADLPAISRKMQQHNARLVSQLKQQWSDVFVRVAQARAYAPRLPTTADTTYAALMKRAYGVVPLEDKCIGQARA